MSWSAESQSILRIYPYWGYIILLLILMGIIGIWYFRERAIRKVKKQVAQCLTAWATQGPFNNGAQSFEAYKRAINIVYRESDNKILLDAIKNHQLMYDINPDEWEKTRIHALEFGDSEAIELGKQLVLTEGLEARSYFSDSDQIKRRTEKVKAINNLIEKRIISGGGSPVTSKTIDESFKAFERYEQGLKESMTEEEFESYLLPTGPNSDSSEPNTFSESTPDVETSKTKKS